MLNLTSSKFYRCRIKCNVCGTVTNVKVPVGRRIMIAPGCGGLQVVEDMPKGVCKHWGWVRCPRCWCYTGVNQV